MQVIFSKIELEISPFLTVIQFYSNIGKKRVGKSPQEISVRTTFRIYLLALKEQDKTKMELPLDMVSISASICRTNGTKSSGCATAYDGIVDNRKHSFRFVE